MSGNGTPSRTRGFAHGLRDHLEAILIALVMALVLKQFCVEAFSIPTSSMHPTLIGENQAPDGVGDRILVDKIANWLGAPRRWEIWVFRFPLDRSRNFIKRVVGMPGDHLKIGSEDGDIWVAPGEGAPFAIVRKPRKVRESLYRAVYPPEEVPERSKELQFDADPTASEPGRRWFRVEEGDPTAWTLDAVDHFAFRGGSRAVLRAAHPIHTSTHPDSWHRTWQQGSLARDMRLRTRVVPDAISPLPAGSEVVLAWVPDGWIEYRLTLSSRPNGSTARVLVDGAVLREVRLEAVLEAGRPVDLEMEAVDGDLHAWIDGAEVAVVPDGRPFRRSHARVGQELRLEAVGAPVVLEDVRIDRDIAYQNAWSPLGDAAEDGVILPAGSYLMIGDNQGDVGDRPEGSYDGRKWELESITLRDGSVIRHDEQARPTEHRDPDTGQRWYTVTDDAGLERRWSAADVDGEASEGASWVPFVDRDLFVGRAFLVFWPAWPDPPGRFRRVR